MSLKTKDDFKNKSQMAKKKKRERNEKLIIKTIGDLIWKLVFVYFIIL